MTHPIHTFLKRAQDQGHTALSSALAKELRMHYGLTWEAVPDELYQTGELIRLLPPLIIDPKAATGEARIARWLASQRARPPGVGYPLGAAPNAATASQGAAWAGLQDAGRAAALTGLPGTGKTWLTARLVEGLQRAGLIVKVCAPTGKAASVLTLKLDGKNEATTIHRLLGLRPGEFPTRAVDADVVIVDESSMVDAELLGFLCEALAPTTSILLVGDHHQLPPVGAGCPFRDVVEGTLLPVFHLDGIVRQAEGNGIIQFTHDLARGRVALPERNVHHFKLAPERMEAEAVDLYCSTRLRDKFQLTNVEKEFLILSPVRQEKFAASTYNLNEQISHRLHPERTIKNSKFTTGDRIMFTVNNAQYGFVNGEVGVLDKFHKRQAVITNDRGFTYALDDYSLGQFVEWAYALTVHKAQGSECKVVALLLHPAARFMYTRQLLYTAATRAAEELLIFGDLALLQAAVQRVDQRTTCLAALMEEPAVVERILDHGSLASYTVGYD